MASMLTTLLYKQHRKTPYQKYVYGRLSDGPRRLTKIPVYRTSEMLRRLFYFSVNTGTWTAVFAVAAIILVSTYPFDLSVPCSSERSLDVLPQSKHPYGTYYWAIFDLGVCGIYSNTLLVNLNGRDYVVGDQAVALSFYKSTGDSSRTARGSGSRGHRRSESAAVEDVSVFEAAKRSQVSEARTAEECF